MTRRTIGSLATLALLCLTGKLDAEAPKGRSGLEDVVTIVFPKEGYQLTVAEAAKGTKFEYQIIVAKDLEGVIALPFGPSFAEPAGPSGLHPRETISGNNYLYGLLDQGLAFPPKEVRKVIPKGTYTHSFAWDGRSWTGPSDFNNPRGKPFPPGTYEITVRLHGKIVRGEETIPYELVQKAKLVLK